jgi:hypothetical protein
MLNWIAKRISTDLISIDRVQSGSAGNLAETTSRGALVTTPPGYWSIFHAPNAAIQATKTKAAVAAKRHVLTGFSAVISCRSTAQDTEVEVYVRDGASGGGTVLWQGSVTCPAGDTRGFAISGLNLVGSENTAMTVEFSGAGVTDSKERVSAWGYTV